MSVNTNSTQRRLALLLDSRALTAIANKLWSVRNRLSLHTDGNLPSAIELYAALKLYKERCDAHRLSYPPLQPYSTTINKHPSIRLLRRLLSVCVATYTMQDPAIFQSLLLAQALPPPSYARAQAAKFSPGYALIRDDLHGALLLCIRGSREAGDLLTNLSSDAEPFLAGHAHQGIVKSARKLHYHLRPLLAQLLSNHKFDKSGLLIFGHSLGGAVASALTLLLRYKRPPKNEPEHVTRILTNARCYSFSPPPFLDRKVMAEVRSRGFPITTIIYGLDVVPRLSAATVDRLLHTLAAYDFSPHVTGAVGKLVRSFTQPVLGAGGAEKIAKCVEGVKVDAKTLASMSGYLATAASNVLQERSASGSLSGSSSSSGRRIESARGRRRGSDQSRDRMRDRKRGDRYMERENGITVDERGRRDGRQGSVGRKRENGDEDDERSRTRSKNSGRDMDREAKRGKDNDRTKDRHKEKIGEREDEKNEVEDEEKSERKKQLTRSRRRASEADIAGQRRGAKKKGKEMNSKSKWQEEESNNDIEMNELDKNQEQDRNNIWGGTVVSAMLLATQVVSSGVESNASRYVRRKGITGSPSAHSLHELSSGSGGSTSAEVETTELTEMFLAGEVWHMDRAFVAPTLEVKQGAWPVPRFVRRKAEYFDHIEASAWMLSDHDTTCMLKDLERMA